MNSDSYLRIWLFDYHDYMTFTWWNSRGILKKKVRKKRSLNKNDQITSETKNQLDNFYRYKQYTPKDAQENKMIVKGDNHPVSRYSANMNSVR